MAEVQQKPKATQVDDSVGVQGECPVDGGQLASGPQAQGRQALGAWWRAYKADRARSERNCPEGGHTHEAEGQWQNQQSETAASFGDLMRNVSDAANDWFDRAKGGEPPPTWQQALEVAVGITASATLTGLAGQLTTHLLAEAGATTDLVVGTFLRTCISSAEGLVRTVSRAAVDQYAGDPHGALRAFCRAQTEIMLQSGISARKAFRVESSGTFECQKLSIEQMQAIERANHQLRRAIGPLVDREMLLGWAALLAGDSGGSPPGEDIEDIDADGVLRITVGGEANRATLIHQARMSGLNPRLRATLSGRPLGEVRPARRPDGPLSSGRTQGVDLVISTSSNGFGVSRETWTALQHRGLAPPGTAAYGRVHFSVFVERSGRVYWVDDDRAWANDYFSGADAGRWFVQHVRRPQILIDDLAQIQLPEVQP